jgi:hypothetical protein
MVKLFVHYAAFTQFTAFQKALKRRLIKTLLNFEHLTVTSQPDVWKNFTGFGPEHFQFLVASTVMPEYQGFYPCHFRDPGGFQGSTVLGLFA